MTPIERAIAAINNSARVQDISGDQCGTVGNRPLHVVTNPAEVARAVLQAIREPSEAVLNAGADRVSNLANWGDCDGPAPLSEYAGPTGDIWHAMIDAALEEG